jgi:hypothetical protein
MIKSIRENMTQSVLGENNAGYDRDKYTCTFSKMIESWRNIWHTRTNATTDPTFPFGFVQVTSSLAGYFTFLPFFLF